MGKKKEKKKNKPRKPRPVFKCQQCGALWVSDFEHICYKCNIIGTPLNESAERMMKWRERESNEAER